MERERERGRGEEMVSKLGKGVRELKSERGG